MPGVHIIVDRAFWAGAARACETRVMKCHRSESLADALVLTFDSGPHII